MVDSYIFDDSCAFIEETGTWSSPADDSVQESLETRNEPPSEEYSKLSPGQKLWYALRSLASLREKACAKQEKIRLLEQQVRDLTQGRDNWKKVAIEAKKQRKADAASAAQAAQTEVPSKQTIILIRE